MENQELKILDEALSFLNTGKMTLDHRNNFINTYDKVSHIPVKKTLSGFYMFHNELLKECKKILKPYKLNCKLYGVFDNKNALEPTKIATILIEKGKNDPEYPTRVAKLMSDYKGSALIPIFNDLNEKVEVIDINYCFTVAYQIYSIDINYKKKSQ